MSIVWAVQKKNLLGAVFGILCNKALFFECQSDVDAFVAKYPSRHLLESQVHCIVYSSVVMEWGVLVVIVHCSGV